MKSYSEFMEYIKENVTDYLPERFESAEITIRQVVKNNDVVLDGLLISSPDKIIQKGLADSTDRTHLQSAIVYSGYDTNLSNIRKRYL